MSMNTMNATICVMRSTNLLLLLLLIVDDFKDKCKCEYSLVITGGCECFLPCCPAHIVSCLAIYRVASL